MESHPVTGRVKTPEYTPSQQKSIDAQDEARAKEEVRKAKAQREIDAGRLHGVPVSRCRLVDYMYDDQRIGGADNRVDTILPAIVVAVREFDGSVDLVVFGSASPILYVNATHGREAGQWDWPAKAEAKPGFVASEAIDR
jgi:hypothetical protein